MPLLRVAPTQKWIVCGAGFGFTIALDQRGPTTDLRAILQKCDNSRATSNKVM